MRQHSAASYAYYFAIDCRPRWGLNANDFVFRRAVGTLELRHRVIPKIVAFVIKTESVHSFRMTKRRK